MIISKYFAIGLYRKGLIDIDVMIEYLAAKKIIYTGVEGRITINGAQRFVIDDV